MRRVANPDKPVANLGGQAAVLDLVARGVGKMTLRLADEIVAVRKLMTRYANVPMALADACLVRMTEIETKATVLTLDADFRVYRRHGRQVIPVLLPDR